MSSVAVSEIGLPNGARSFRVSWKPLAISNGIFAGASKLFVTVQVKLLASTTVA